MAGGAVPDNVVRTGDLSLEDIDKRLEELRKLAPRYRMDKDAVRHRFARTSVPRDELENRLMVEMKLRLQEYDREAQVRQIDKQILTLLATRNLVRVADGRRYHHSPPPLPRTGSPIRGLCLGSFIRGLCRGGSGRPSRSRSS